MSRNLRIFGLGTIAIFCWGCGGGEPVKPAEQGAANNAAGGAPPAGGGMPGAGAPGGVGAAPAAAAKDKPAASSASTQDLLSFLPETIEIAVGANITALGDKELPFGQQVLGQFRPILTMLDRAGIKESEVDQLWSGVNREKAEFAICVRTKADYAPEVVTKKLGASETAEKIGAARVHKITFSQAADSAVACIDAKTLMLGRYTSVVAGLQNPKPGKIQAGLKAMKTPEAYFWISGGDLASMRQLHLRHIESANWMSPDAATPQAMAIGLTKNTGAAALVGGGGSGPQGGKPGGMPGGGMPGGGMPGGGSPGGPGGGMPGMGGGGGAGGAGGAVSKRPLMVVVGWTFTSELAAKVMEKIFEDLMESMKPKQSSGPGGAGMGAPPGGMGGPGGAGPGGAGPGGAGMGPPGGAGGAGRRGRGGKKITNIPRFELAELEVFQQQGSPPGGPGMPGGMPGMPGGGNQPSEDDPNVTFYSYKREDEILRMWYSVPKEDTETVGKIIAKGLAAIAAPPLDDGLFLGSLPLLAQGLHQWEGATPPEKFTGVRSAGGELPEEHYSWMTEILPYIGYQSLYNKFDFSKPWHNPLNLPYAQTSIPAFLNMADPRTIWNERGIPPMGVTHFAGMSGVEDRRNVVAAQLPRTDPRAGVFGYDRIARVADITDGTSNTILMIGTGELTAAWVLGGGATIRGARQPYFDKFTGFGSRGLPAPGAYVLMADGSARVVSATVDPEIFKAMCTIHGSEQIDLGKVVGQSGN